MEQRRSTQVSKTTNRTCVDSRIALEAMPQVVLNGSRWPCAHPFFDSTSLAGMPAERM